jgi:peptidoglycan/LPS O-acetylase OafA/YrhL
MKDQIMSLTSTRAIAALLIVVFHYGTNVYPFYLAPKLVDSLNLAVSYFFVLSGFVMYKAYSTKQVHYGEFMQKRIARIYPLYLVAGLLAFLPFLYVFFFKGLPLKINYPSEILGLFFLQAFIPQYVFTSNFPSWSLSVEMFLYLLFPLFLYIAQKNIRTFLAVTICIFITTQVVHLIYYPYAPDPAQLTHNFFQYNPLVYLNEFLAGMACAYIYDLEKVKQYKIPLLPAFFFGIIILLVIYRPLNISYSSGLLAPLFMLLILSTAINDNRILRSRFLFLLGEISFGIYILQVPLRWIFYTVNARFFHLGINAAFYTYVLFLIVASYCSYKIIEIPLRKKITSYRIKT